MRSQLSFPTRVAKLNKAAATRKEQTTSLARRPPAGSRSRARAVPLGARSRAASPHPAFLAPHPPLHRASHFPRPNALANPPHGVGYEFETLGFIEALGGFNQPEVLVQRLAFAVGNLLADF
nr:hypothetical protein [Tanacetum cinerariifolium]